MYSVFSNEKAFPELFHLVQTSGIFRDSKVFADAVSKHCPAEVNRDFLTKVSTPGFNLKLFLEQNFVVPLDIEIPIAQKRAVIPMREHLDAMWALLERVPDMAENHSSLTPLPCAYLVPGGRFREIYYWDSYFTMLGYSRDRGPTMLVNMLDNFAYLSREIGHIPNGNRSYFCSRSQPPVFSLMVELLATYQEPEEVYSTYVSQLEAEYGFWMKGVDEVTQEGEHIHRVIRVGDGYLNRYWDNQATPRPESYLEDLELARKSTRSSEELFRDIRAACESGWDFSTRWLDDGQDFENIQTTSVVPVDLNVLIYKLEKLLSVCYESAGRVTEASDMAAKAQCRCELIQELFFNDESGMFVDLNLSDLSHRPTLSLAGMYPLFTGIATEYQAEKVASLINERFLRPGGWVTSLNRSAQQWDAPNGWAPLQWVTFEGLRRYGFEGAAREGALNWVRNNKVVYGQTGALLEKYNVDEIGSLATGGEYKVQHGFGWTNGVLVELEGALAADVT